MTGIVGWIRVGDKTSCGGVVVEGDESCKSGDIAYAHQGSRVCCEKNCIISDGYADSMINGRAQVIHGMKTTGGCACFSTLNGVDGVLLKGNPLSPQHALPIYIPMEGDYDQHLVLVDENDNPLEGVPYKLVDARGKILEGFTQADGKTGVITGQEGDSLRGYIACKEPKV